MIRHVCFAAVTVAVSTLGAHAADLPLKAPRLVASSLFTWTGFYGGLNAGYKFGGDDDVRTEGQAAPNIANIAGGARPGFVPLNRDGFIGGGQIGYNYQIGHFVAGVETDIMYTDFRDSRSVTTAQLGTGAPLNNTFSSRLNYLGTARARFGATYDRSLFYVTGGLAYGEVEQHIDMFGANGGLQFSGDRTKVKTGFAVGAGLEQAITRNVTVKGEYLYYDLGEDTGHIVRVGLNYKFD